MSTSPFAFNNPKLRAGAVPEAVQHSISTITRSLGRNLVAAVGAGVGLASIALSSIMFRARRNRGVESTIASFDSAGIVTDWIQRSMMSPAAVRDVKRM